MTGTIIKPKRRRTYEEQWARAMAIKRRKALTMEALTLFGEVIAGIIFLVGSVIGGTIMFLLIAG